MKKIALLICVALLSINGFSQKKKGASKTAISKSIVLNKAGNVSAEVVKDNLYLFITNQSKKDTILIKAVDVKNLPVDCKITPFTTGKSSFYLLVWTEKTSTTTDLKKEEVVEVNSQIYDITTKTLVLNNVQKTTNITEKVFLDKLKNASETQQRIRREGAEFTLTPEGDVLLKTKTAQTKLSFSPTDNKYVDSKLIPSGTPAKKGTKK